MTKKRIRITDGGIALPLGNNTFLMRGRLHSQGGIGIGNGGKNDIEVEDGEVIKFNKDNIQVLSDQPMLNGISPANALLAGGNFNKIFKAQQNINGNYGGSYGKDGTEKEIKKENIPTKEEYITQKLDSIRNNALERSRKKTQDETTVVTEADVYGKKELIDELQQEYNNALSTYNIWLEDIYNKYKKDNPITSEKYTKLDFIENNKKLKYYYEHLNDAKNLLEDAKNGKYKGHELSNCIANLSEMFPHGLPYGNESFRSNPKKYGFSLIDTWDVEPGDLIQYIFNGRPNHAMIYNGIDENGNHTFNYSNGFSPSIEGGGYGTNKHYPDVVAKDGKHLWDVDVYRYTGTPQDSIQWSNEYDQKYGKTLKNGGQINMKLKHKNKQDITDMVMNEILPHSTGKRMKFDMGGKYLLGNIGSNILNGLAQGITGIISGSQTAKFFRNLPDIASSFIPVARQHISSDVRHILNPQLSEIKRGVSTLIDNAQKNTSSSKNYRQQAANATLKGIEESQKVYNSAAEIQTQRQMANANLQAEYDKLDTVNKINAIKEQNDYNMQRLIGEQNAKNQIAQSIGDSIGDMTKNIGNSLMDYATMKHDLLKSNQAEDYDEYFEWNNSDMIKNGTLKVPTLTITKLNYKNRITKDYDKFVSIYGKDIVDGWLNQLK